MTTPLLPHEGRWRLVHPDGRVVCAAPELETLQALIAVSVELAERTGQPVEQALVDYDGLPPADAFPEARHLRIVPRGAP